MSRLLRAAPQAVPDGPTRIAARATGPLDGGPVVQRQIDPASLPAVVLPADADVAALRSYLRRPVNRHHETFAQTVEATLEALPSEAASESLGVMWNNLRFLLGREEPDALELGLCSRYTVALAERVNAIHARVQRELRDTVAGTLDGQPFRAAVEQRIAELPLAARSMSLDTMWNNLGYFLEREEPLEARELALGRKYLAALTAGVRKLGSLVETRTRMGFEIETNNHFVVAPSYRKIAESLVNVTLATSEVLQFLIDDIKQEGGSWVVQIEFRSPPFKREELAGQAAGGPSKGAKSPPAPIVLLKKRVHAAIDTFPVAVFGHGVPYDSVEAALKAAGWTGTPELHRLAPGLSSLEKGARVTPKPIQHVTHSVPLSSFLRLGAKDRDLLVPGSGASKDMESLLAFFLSAKIIPQSSGGTITVTTKGRNKATPNIKSGIDTIIGMLPRDRAAAVVAQAPFRRRPGAVTVGQETATIPPLEVFEGLPPFPRFNVHEGRAHLSSEEKLQPLLFDTRARDIRVLVEHRVDVLVKAVNDAMAGKSGPLEPYLQVFAKLDGLEGDATFRRWFL